MSLVARESERTLQTLEAQGTALEGLTNLNQVVAADSLRIADLGTTLPKIVDTRLLVIGSDLKSLTIATGEDISTEIAALRSMIQEQTAMLTALSTGFDRAAFKPCGQQGPTLLPTDEASNILVAQRPSQPWAMCDCRRTRTSRSWRTSGHANPQLAVTRRNVFEHSSCCPFSRMVGKKHGVAQFLDARFRVSSASLGMILDFGLGWSLHDGSLSVRPQLSMQRTVTTNSSPAFRIIFALSLILVSEAEFVSPSTTDEVDDIFMLACKSCNLCSPMGTLCRQIPIHTVTLCYHICSRSLCCWYVS